MGTVIIFFIGLLSTTLFSHAKAQDLVTTSVTQPPGIGVTTRNSSVSPDTFTIKINIDNILKQFLERNSITTNKLTLPTSALPVSETTNTSIPSDATKPDLKFVFNESNIDPALLSFLSSNISLTDITPNTSTETTTKPKKRPGVYDPFSASKAARKYGRTDGMLIATLVLLSFAILFGMLFAIMAFVKYCPGPSSGGHPPA